MPGEKTQLSDLEVFEVSLVPEGANGKKFFLMKSKNGEKTMPKSQEEILKSLMEGKLENESEIDAVLKESKLSKEEQSAVKGAIRLLGSVEKDIPEEIVKRLNLKPGETPEEILTREKKEAKEKKEADAKAKKDDLKKEGEVPKDKKDITKELSLEGLPKATADQIAAIFKANDAICKENEKLKETVEKEKDARITKEFQEKAAVYKSLGAEKDTLSSVLKEISIKCGSETLQKVEGILKAANKAIEKGDLFKEAGSNANDGAAGSDPWAKIEKMAEGLVQKSESGLSKAKAIDTVLKTEQGQTLYQQYENERAS